MTQQEMMLDLDKDGQDWRNMNASQIESAHTKLVQDKLDKEQKSASRTHHTEKKDEEHRG